MKEKKARVRTRCTRPGRRRRGCCGRWWWRTAGLEALVNLVVGDEQVGVNIILRAIEPCVGRDQCRREGSRLQQVRDMDGDEGFNAQTERCEIWSGWRDRPDQSSPLGLQPRPRRVAAADDRSRHRRSPASAGGVSAGGMGGMLNASVGDWRASRDGCRRAHSRPGPRCDVSPRANRTESTRVANLQSSNFGGVAERAFALVDGDDIRRGGAIRLAGVLDGGAVRVAVSSLWTEPSQPGGTHARR